MIFIGIAGSFALGCLGGLYWNFVVEFFKNNKNKNDDNKVKKLSNFRKFIFKNNIDASIFVSIIMSDRDVRKLITQSYIMNEHLKVDYTGTFEEIYELEFKIHEMYLDFMRSNGYSV